MVIALSIEGGVYSYSTSSDSSPSFTNCTLSGNTARFGGGVYSYSSSSDSSPSFTNCTLSGNTASGVYSSSTTSSSSSSSSSSITLNNTILWDNEKNGSKTGAGADIVHNSNGTNTTNATNSMLQLVSTSYTATNNNNLTTNTNNLFATDPLFTDTANGDYSITACSPAKDAGAGTISGVTAPVTDILGNARVGTIDIGAFENQDPIPTNPTVATYLPVNSATGVAVNDNLVITFNKDINFGTGNIKLYKVGTAIAVASYNVAVTNTNTTISGATLTINPSTDLDSDATYYLKIDATAIKGCPQNFYAGIADATTYKFETVKTPTITFNDINKVYGNANFTLGATTNSGGTISYTIVGTSDVVSLSGSTVSILKAGTVTLKATVTANGNYLSGTKDITLTVAKKGLTVTGITVSTKEYDGTTTAVVDALNPTLTGLVLGDVIPVSATGTFDTKNKGTGKIVTLVTSYTGTAKDNYTITDQTTVTGDITAKAISITAEDKSKVYNGSVYAGYTVSYAGFVTGETETSLDLTNLAYAGTAKDATNAGDYVITPQGIISTNYAITYTDGSLAITKAEITGISFDDAIFVYDGTEKTILVRGDISDLTVSYDANTSTAEGVTPVQATVTRSNYNDLVLTASLKIREIAGDTNGDGIITSPEIAGDLNEDGVITLPEILGDVNGDGVITSGEISGDEIGGEKTSIKQKFEDVLVFNNSSNKYVAWEWYHNGVLVSGATKQIYQSNMKLDGAYYAIATDKTGKRVRSNTLTIDGTAKFETIFKVYPNPLTIGQNATVVTTLAQDLLIGSSLAVYDISGSIKVEAQEMTSQKMELTNLPTIAGLYIVRLRLENGLNLAFSIIIK